MANRTEWIHARVTADELGMLSVAAEDEGVSRSELVREIVAPWLAAWQVVQFEKQTAATAAEQRRRAREAADAAAQAKIERMRRNQGRDI